METVLYPQERPMYRDVARWIESRGMFPCIEFSTAFSRVDLAGCAFDLTKTRARIASDLPDKITGKCLARSVLSLPFIPMHERTILVEAKLDEYGRVFDQALGCSYLANETWVALPADHSYRIRGGAGYLIDRCAQVGIGIVCVAPREIADVLLEAEFVPDSKRDSVHLFSISEGVWWRNRRKVRKWASSL